MGVFVCHQQTAGHTLENALVEILQGLKFLTHLDELGF